MHRWIRRLSKVSSRQLLKINRTMGPPSGHQLVIFISNHVSRFLLAGNRLRDINPQDQH